jgi:hypothetical protein
MAIRPYKVLFVANIKVLCSIAVTWNFFSAIGYSGAVRYSIELRKMGIVFDRSCL